MPTRERLTAIGTARGLRLAREFGSELRHARQAAGLSQASVAAAVGMSQETISRFELGQPPYPDVVQAARAARIVRLDLSVRCYPAPGQLRDAAHVALIQRLLDKLPKTIARTLEAPVRPGDLRAWDVLLLVEGRAIGVVAETRIRDLQALLRREHLKQVEGKVDCLLLLVAETRHNRGAMKEVRSLLSSEFPLRTRAVMSALALERAPAKNGIVVL